jgi:hypothetical protein
MDLSLESKITASGMSAQVVSGQLENFRNGFPFLKIAAPATPENGIKVLSENEIAHFLETYPAKASQIVVVKFGPASGAASRMFKDLFSFVEGDGDILKSPFVQKFMDHIQEFAFFDDLNTFLQSKGKSIGECLKNEEYHTILNALLSDEGLGYGNLPKALLRFHNYPTERRTPAHEHLIEGTAYAVGIGNSVKIHFTVSPEHETKFKEEIASILPSLQRSFELNFEISYSQQKKSTDTIAVNSDNSPFVEEDGGLLFRPAGHGALLENLNELVADLIFIKNIDNVVPDRLKEQTKTYKIAIGGLLLEVQEKIFEALEALDTKIDLSSITKARAIFSGNLGTRLPQALDTWSLEKQAEYLKNKLNRPIRVCGMVKNTGEPGGGPFWIREGDGSESLQILETAQIDLNDPASLLHFKAATHFNPVDLVCGTKDYQGKPFDLLRFRDNQTGFITEKSKSGRELKALELPGLWNGAMSDWNTIFVEVPLITFNPVKTVNDLLREEHQ